MKAIRLLEYGGQSLVFDDVPTPTIAPDEIWLVKIKSTAVNHLDLVEAPPERQDRYSRSTCLGYLVMSFSGVVEQTGSDIAAYAPGDPVFGTTTGMGAYAEYLAVKAAVIARKPSNLSFEEAASVPVAAQSCTWQGNLHPRSPGRGANDPDPWWRRRCGRLCGATGITSRRRRHCHGKRRG